LRTPLTRAIDVAWMIAGGCVLLWVILVIVEKVRAYNPVPTGRTAVFKVGDCFVRNGVRETWDKEADGKVIFKGLTRYLLMEFSEADRKYGGDKLGYDQQIDTFDMAHRKVLCPLSWTPKGVTK
jgi:hypothetical protein